MIYALATKIKGLRLLPYGRNDGNTLSLRNSGNSTLERYVREATITNDGILQQHHKVNLTNCIMATRVLLKEGRAIANIEVKCGQGLTIQPTDIKYPLRIFVKPEMN